MNRYETNNISLKSEKYEKMLSDGSYENGDVISKEITTTDIFFKRLDYLTEIADKLKRDTLQKLQYLIVRKPDIKRESTKPIGESEFFKEVSDRIDCIEYMLIDIQSVIDSLDI